MSKKSTRFSHDFKRLEETIIHLSLYMLFNCLYYFYEEYFNNLNDNLNYQRISYPFT